MRRFKKSDYKGVFLAGHPSNGNNYFGFDNTDEISKRRTQLLVKRLPDLPF
jgi:hypothetical protein